MSTRVIRHEVIQPLDQSIKLIPLTKGKTVIVDADDYASLSQFHWYAYECKRKERSLFYAARFEGRRMVLMHRIIVGGDPDTVDHRSGNTLDNRKVNLRPCTDSQNKANRGKAATNTSGFKGVSWKKQLGKWQAQASVNGVNVNLGHYESREEAYGAYTAFIKARDGEFFHE